MALTSTAREQFRRLSKLREADAAVLLKQKRWSGAYYLAGYAVECALKAAISREFKKSAIPDKRFVSEVYTHDLVSLRRQANLESQFSAAVFSIPDLNDNWATVKDWSEQSRYEEHAEPKARDMLFAVSNPTSGVLTWLRRYY